VNASDSLVLATAPFELPNAAGVVALRELLSSLPHACSSKAIVRELIPDPPSSA